MKWIKVTEDTVIPIDWLTYIYIKGVGTDIALTQCKQITNHEHYSSYAKALYFAADHTEECVGGCITVLLGMHNTSGLISNIVVLNPEFILYYLEVPRCPISIEEEKNINLKWSESFNFRDSYYEDIRKNTWHNKIKKLLF